MPSWSSPSPSSFSEQTIPSLRTPRTFLGSLPWCLALAYAGYKLGEHWDEVGSVLHKYDILIGIGILALVALFLYRHLGRQKAVGRRP